jgi:hypothetical protein
MAHANKTSSANNITVREACSNALDAFWREVANMYPAATTGDLSPERTLQLDDAAQNAVHEWVVNNVRHGSL